jgi:peptidoglycan biosynthesis protein MviN/MurJ (putative lipid II flippase)
MATTFSILVLAIIPMGGNYIYGTLLTATGSLWAMNRIFVLILGINIVLNLFLLPRFGIPGVALASLITHSLAFILQLRLCLKKQVVGSSASLILRIFLFSVLTGLSVISLKFFLPFRAPNLPLILLTGLLLSGIAMGITGMIHKSDWRHLPNETVT